LDYPRKDKMPYPKKGTLPYYEWIDKLSRAHMGFKYSEESRKKMSDSHIGLQKGEKHPSFGKKHSEESIQKMRDAKVGKYVGEKNPMFGKPVPIEVREKIRKTLIGKMAGEKNPAWKGGISFEPYCPKFTKEFKERVRSFFGYRCQVCGHIWQISENKLAVHHVNYRKDACCNTSIIPLFVPVCLGGCHGKTNHHREFWEDWFTEIINEFYGGKCYFSKEEMIAHGY
jgi:hypothetical protein